MRPEVSELPGTNESPTLVIERRWNAGGRWESVRIDDTNGRFLLSRSEEDCIFGYFTQLLAANAFSARIRGLSLALKFALKQNRPLPRELSEALSNPLDAWIKFEHATLNEAFGLPRRGAKETANARRRQTLEAKIFHAIAICRGDKAIDKALFEHVGKLVGLGATQTEKIFRGSRQRTFQNYLRGGAKPGRPKKIKIPHSPT